MRGTVRIGISGGPFDGGAIDAPRRTAPGLYLLLCAGSTTAGYVLARVDGRVTAVALTAADAAAEQRRRPRRMQEIVLG